MIRDPTDTPGVPGGLPFDATQISFTQAGTGAVARTVQAKERDIVSVKDFGAVGDGVTDDTAAFTLAQATGKWVFVPQSTGSYITNNTITTTRLFGPGIVVANGVTLIIGIAPNTNLAWNTTTLSLIAGTGTDATFGTISVHDIRTTIDRHAFEDYSVLNTTDTGQGYASYDAKATMNNSLSEQHFVGFQSRLIYTGSANLTNYFHSFDSAPNHTGSGTIVRAVGLNLADFGGSGAITTNIGIYLADFTRGAANYGIYQEAQTNALNIIGAPICFLTSAGALNYFNDAVGKSITYGYGSAGQTQFGVHNFYDGKAGLIFSITSAGVKPKASGYLSSDGTVGLTQASTTTVGKSITLKDGLVVAFA